MERNEIINHLNDLIQLDVDAVEAYEQVIKHLEYDDIAHRFRDFQDDHKTHITTLSALVQELDGKPIKQKPDLKGYLMEGFTLLMSVAGSMAAMEAMQANEMTTNKRYARAAEMDLPEHIHKVIQTHHSQEQRHLRYIQQVIETPRHELR
jgi:rubrerythrin